MVLYVFAIKYGLVVNKWFLLDTKYECVSDCLSLACFDLCTSAIIEERDL